LDGLQLAVAQNAVQHSSDQTGVQAQSSQPAAEPAHKSDLNRFETDLSILAFLDQYMPMTALI
jgi:hypothetical protein